jgi:hypothetical protein
VFEVQRLKESKNQWIQFNGVFASTELWLRPRTLGSAGEGEGEDELHDKLRKAQLESFFLDLAFEHRWTGKWRFLGRRAALLGL